MWGWNGGEFRSLKRHECVGLCQERIESHHLGEEDPIALPVSALPCGHLVLHVFEVALVIRAHTFELQDYVSQRHALLLHSRPLGEVFLQVRGQ